MVYVDARLVGRCNKVIWITIHCTFIDVIFSLNIDKAHESIFDLSNTMVQVSNLVADNFMDFPLKFILNSQDFLLEIIGHCGGPADSVTFLEA